MILLRVLLSLVLILPLGIKTGVVLNWAVQQDYIAQNLCVNRDKPQMQCNGKCILMQKLDMVSDFEDSSTPLPKIAQLEMHLFLVNYGPDTMFPFIKRDKISFTLLNKVGLYRLMVFDIFHPPRFIS